MGINPTPLESFGLGAENVTFADGHKGRTLQSPDT